MSTLMGADAIAMGIKSGNINIAGAAKVEVMDLSNESKESQLKHAELLKKFETTKRARNIVVPTLLEDVKAHLRAMGHPVTLFGENAMDRRDRLRTIIASLQLDDEEYSNIQKMISEQLSKPAYNPTIGIVAGGSEVKMSAASQLKEAFYTPASDELIKCREAISIFSFEKAHQRLEEEYNMKVVRKTMILNDSNMAGTMDSKLASEIENLREKDKRVIELYQYHNEVSLNMNQFSIEDSRPPTCVRYNNTGSFIATGSMSSVVNVYNTNNLNLHYNFRGHTERVTKVNWHPSKEMSNIIVSCSADAKCIIWDCNRAPVYCCNDKAMGGGGSSMDVATESSNPILGTLVGHQGAVSDCKFHPLGKYVATASHDYSWRLWDATTLQNVSSFSEEKRFNELLLQDGHNKELTSLDIHPDGSLVATADSVGNVMMWDVRCGLMVTPFQGHIKKITNLEFHPCNGFQFVTGGIDNMIRIWDIRKRKCMSCIPAHSNVISHVGYSKSGELLISSSFDGDLKVWRTRDNVCINTLTTANSRAVSGYCGTSNNAGKIMSCDISSDEKHIISVSYDRSIKLWAHKSEF